MPDPAWHLEVITPETRTLLASLAANPALASCYLAGGTALALHRGHRRSHDLDLFRPDPFDATQLLATLSGHGVLATTALAENSADVTIDAVKVSVLRYEYPLLFAPSRLHGMPIADPRDVGAMKLSAIAMRGARRDFIDLHVVAEQWGLAQVLDWADAKFGRVRINRVHWLKALTYFEDAEQEPEPDMILPLPWSQVRAFFERETVRLL